MWRYLTGLSLQTSPTAPRGSTAAAAAAADDALRGLMGSDEGEGMAGMTPMWGDDAMGSGQVWALTRSNSGTPTGNGWMALAGGGTPNSHGRRSFDCLNRLLPCKC